jgi:hypothetical protein
MMMELPADVGYQVPAMLKPQVRPFAILVFEDLGGGDINISVKAGSITKDERNVLGLTDDQSVMGVEWWARCTDAEGVISNTVYTAMALEFEFATEADRARWERCEQFEMRRKAVYSFRQD